LTLASNFHLDPVIKTDRAAEKNPGDLKGSFLRGASKAASPPSHLVLPRSTQPLHSGQGQVRRFTKSDAFHMGESQQSSATARTQFKDQTRRWLEPFIVADCPWHRLQFSGWVAQAAPDNLRDLTLWYESSVNEFVWPLKNWDEGRSAKLMP